MVYIHKLSMRVTAAEWLFNIGALQSIWKGENFLVQTMQNKSCKKLNCIRNNPNQESQENNICFMEYAYTWRSFKWSKVTFQTIRSERYHPFWINSREKTYNSRISGNFKKKLTDTEEPIHMKRFWHNYVHRSSLLTLALKVYACGN